ncbi:MAG: hypothetical protein QXV69_09430 [Sulfolobaceae archaeon]
MESSVVSFILVAVTLIIGLITFSLFGIFSSQQYYYTNLQQVAQNIANGFYITISKNYTYQGNVILFIIPMNFNYNGTIYLTIFYVDMIYYGNNYITPLFAKGYGKINYSSIINPPLVKLYYPDLREMYEGTIPLWKTVTGALQILSFPQGYAALLMIFIKIEDKYIMVGYQWLR